MNPLLTKVSPPGHDPLTTNAGIEVLSDHIYTPLASVICTGTTPPHPLSSAHVRRLSCCWLVFIISVWIYVLPYPSASDIGPVGIPNNNLTSASLSAISVVLLRPNSTLTSYKEIAPDAGSVICYSVAQ
jgi:hypothetical protein